ncbi:hypothetical protein H5410_040735 [Solanum commersonii]|uniref:Uncharacterized protein n=1 Tax=Solanum commersonii TaxID=4109 RepID=A0A9J5XQZ9_SOLCO|nr:hypothetical protein H5410_040735 [Solanum commersonii]
MASGLGSEIEALCLVGLTLRILTCLIYDWADHRQVSDPISLVSEPRNFHDIKSTRLEEVDIHQNFDLLNKWTIPKVNIKTIYDYGWFDKISNKQLIKTTEQSLALNSSEQTIRLLNKRDIEFQKSQYKFLHISMIQIASKPLTLKGLPETFLAGLSDAINLNF